MVFIKTLIQVALNWPRLVTANNFSLVLFLYPNLTQVYELNRACLIRAKRIWFKMNEES